MGYIELKIGQVALRPKKITPPPPPPITPDWTEATLPRKQSWIGIAYGAGKFVAVAEFSRRIATSSDGITWETVILPYVDGAGGDWTDIAYGNGKFAICSSTDKCVAYSSDGVTWSTVGYPGGELPGIYYAISFAGDTFFAFGYEGHLGYIDYSTDAVTWHRSKLENAASTYGMATYGDGKYIIVKSGGAICITEPTAETGTSLNIPLSNIRDITYGNGKFVAVGSNAGTYLVAYSTDGITWATSPLGFNGGSIIYGDNKFVIVGEKSAYSTDGITWTTMIMPIAADWNRVTYGGGKFVAVSISNDGAYSSDGINWKQMSMPFGYVHSVAYGDGKFVAVAGVSNIGAYSMNGINWTKMDMPYSVNWLSVTYGNNRFVAVAEGDKAAYFEIKTN